jgi:diguanylate cyclase (GGDEF)-like protein
LALVLAVVGVGLAPAALGGGGVRAPDGLSLAWWQLAGVFALAGVFVFHVEIDDEAHTFSLSEVPLVLGLLFSRPGELVLARLLGEALVLVVLEHQKPTKLIFNASVFFTETITALSIFRAVCVIGASTDPMQLATWAAALLGVAVAGVLGAVAVWAAIRIHGGQASARQLATAVTITAAGNTSLAIVAAALLHDRPTALIPLVFVAFVVVAAYRGYTQLTKRYAGLELLYQFTRITSGAQSPDQTLRHVLDESRRLLRSRRVLIALYAPGEDVPWLYLDRSGPDHPDGPSVIQEEADLQPDDRLTVPRGNLPDDLRDRVLRQRHLVLLPRTVTQPHHRDLLQALQAKDCIAAPLISGGDITGVLVVCDRLGGVSTFDGEDGRLFATLASQAAVALENGQLIERLRSQATDREHEALHDALTQLPNRTLFTQRLQEALQVPAPNRLAVFLLDLDGFKVVNDTLGHHTGDQLLRQVAQRLSDTVADHGTVARLGGDEFAVLLPQLRDIVSGLQLATVIITAIREPIVLATMTVEVGASLGMAICPDHGQDVDSLLQRADVAMYAAKQAHTGVALYDPTTDTNSQTRLRLAGELRTAMTSHQLEVWYQPIARSFDLTVTSAEALVRWNHPDLGRLSPDEFIPIAERTGLIHDLTLYVLQAALAQAHAWHAAGWDLSVSVNLPPQVLRDVNWPTKVLDLLHQQNAAPTWLTFEITETGIMTDPQRMIGILRDLAATGITFSIDDFGTGYSSLAYLQQLPVTKIKIDKAFVTTMLTDPAAAVIAQSVIDLARGLDLVVIAEGVEDQPTLEHLASIGCHLIQGYHLSRPLPATDFTQWLTHRQWPTRAGHHPQGQHSPTTSGP